MRYEIQNELSATVLCLTEQLTFADRPSFDGLIPSLLSAGKLIIVDLDRLDYMDSSALGMLLTLRDATQKAGLSVSLRSPQGDVKELLTISCFETLFMIE